MTDRTTVLTTARAANLLLDTDPYVSCDECFARLDEYVERLEQDADHDDPAMRAHLLGCGACADEADALLELLRSEA